jgi:signal peptidase I
VSSDQPNTPDLAKRPSTGTDTELNHRRQPWAAAALSLLAAGLGQIYAGRIVKGLFFYCAWTILLPLGYVMAISEPSQVGLIFLLIAPSILLMALYWFSVADAYYTARRTAASYEPRDYNRASVYILLAIVGLTYPFAMLSVYRDQFFAAFYIPTSSMSPSIVDGDRILVNKYNSSFPRYGELIAFRPRGQSTPAAAWIKRVIGLPGDHIEVRDQRVFVNGQELVRRPAPDDTLPRITLKGKHWIESHHGSDYLVTTDSGETPEAFETTVEDDHIFVLGDNRNRSRDSRFIGSIHAADLIGRAEYIYWPADSWARFGTVRGKE